MKILRLATYMIFFTFLCKILGFLREIILASTLGLSYNTDVYLLAATFPNIIFSVITIALSTTFIPSYLNIKEIDGDERALMFTNTIINILILSGIVVTFFGVMFAHKLLPIVAIGFDEKSLSITIIITRIMFPSIIFLSIMSIFRGFLQSNNNFLIPAIRTVPYNIMLILSILFSGGQVKIIAIGTLLAVITQLVFLIPFVIKEGYRYKPVIKIKDKYIINTFKSVFPIIIGLSVLKINILIDRSIASTLDTGSISALSFSNRVIDVILEFMTVSLGAISYKKLSEVFIKDKSDFNKVLNKSINLFVIFLIPITAMFMTFSHVIIKILFQRGEFTEIATIMTSKSLFFYAISIVGFGISDILTKAYFAINNNKIPMINGIITLGLNIILNLILVKFLSFKGIALATSITSIVSTIFLYLVLIYKLNIKPNKLIFLLVKVTFISIVLAVTSKEIFLYMKLININEIFSLIIAFIIGFILYLFLCILLDIKDVKHILYQYFKVVIK